MILFNSYDRDWSWLSNFHPCVIRVPVGGGDGNYVPVFPSAEHVYQFSKWDRRGVPIAEIERVVESFRSLDAPMVKKWGRTVTLRPRWDAMKLRIMAQVLREKYAQNDELRQRLVGTGDEMLAHLSPWDTFWGVDRFRVGKNHLGLLTMKVRGA